MDADSSVESTAKDFAAFAIRNILRKRLLRTLRPVKQMIQQLLCSLNFHWKKLQLKSSRKKWKPPGQRLRLPQQWPRLKLKLSWRTSRQLPALTAQQQLQSQLRRTRSQRRQKRRRTDVFHVRRSWA